MDLLTLAVVVIAAVMVVALLALAYAALQLKKTLETLHNVSITVGRGEVDISELQPTQGKVFADELEGRIEATK